MHPKRLIQTVKDRIKELNKEKVTDVLDFLMEYSSSTHLILPINNQIKIIEIESVLYVKEPKKGEFIICTLQEKVEYKCLSYCLLKNMENNCESIKFLNNGLIVNINKVVKYHKYLRKLFFINGDHVDITGEAMKYIMREVLGKECELTQDTYSGNFKPFIN